MKKNNNALWTSQLSDEAIEFTQPEIMVKLIATIDPNGFPHITTISSNRAISKEEIVWGQFMEGSSKRFVQEISPKQGIFYMTANMPFKFIQAKAKLTNTKTDGKEIEHFNNSDLMRFMTYMRVYKVFYNDVISATQLRNLPLGGIIKGILKNVIGKGGAKTKTDEKRLPFLGYNIFKGMINPKFLSYLDSSDGFPIIVPCIQLQAADNNRLVFPLTSLREDLKKVPANSNVAVFGMNMELVSQLVKGTYLGVRTYRKIKFGVIDILEVYNSCPPIPGNIYPELAIRPKITEFV